jgi:hypothetical protein
VLVPGRDVKHLPANFAHALAAVLIELGVPATHIVPELDAAAEVVIARTNSRSHLGTLNEYAYMLRWQLGDESSPDLAYEAVRLSRTPVGPLGPGWPDEVALRLLGCETPRYRGRGE